MPVPLSLISTLNSVKKGVEPIVDSFENWPNGTDNPPEGWSEEDFGSGAAGASQNTNNVTDGSYTMFVDASNQSNPVLIVYKEFDLTNFNTLKIDAIMSTNTFTFDMVIGGDNKGEFFADVITTFTFDISGYTGITKVQIEQNAVYNSKMGFYTGAGYYDNLRLLSE